MPDVTSDDELQEARSRILTMLRDAFARPTLHRLAISEDVEWQDGEVEKGSILGVF